jgi:hypothetical protein
MSRACADAHQQRVPGTFDVTTQYLSVLTSLRRHEHGESAGSRGRRFIESSDVARPRLG